jgi:hypothetical protein
LMGCSRATIGARSAGDREVVGMGLILSTR